MAKKKCAYLKEECASPVSSACVALETEHVFESFDEQEICCEPSINDLFAKFDTLIKTLQDNIDLTQLNKECMIFDNQTVKVNDLFQFLVSFSCALKDRVTQLETDVAAIDVLSQTINIDLSCLGNPCTGTNHSVLYIITTLVSAYCALKAQVDNL